MAIAIATKLRESFESIRIVATPSFGPYEDRAKYNLLTTHEFPGKFKSRLYARFAPKPIRSSMGMINPEEVDIVLDASGFAFSDQGSKDQAPAMLRMMRDKKRASQKFILMPQAFGPFENLTTRTLCKEIFERAVLVFARDDTSHRYAGEICPQKTLRQAPDFTIGLKPSQLNKTDLPSKFVAIVPNMRMMDKTKNGGNYLEFLREALNTLENKNQNIVFVLHDSKEDHKVIAMLGKNAEQNITVSDQDPLILKAILGRADLVIGSRFHSLVSALSQNTPCIGTSWSHKYQHLFEQFNCIDFLMQDLNDLNKLQKCITQLIDPKTGDTTSRLIANAYGKLKIDCDLMWKEVIDVIHESMKNAN